MLFFSFIRSGDQWSTVYSYNMCSMFEKSASLNSRGVFQKLWWNIYRCFGAFCESTNIHCGYYDSASEINWFNLVISPFDNTSWICCLKRQEKVFFFMYACNILKKEENNYNLIFLLNSSVLAFRRLVALLIIGYRMTYSNSLKASPKVLASVVWWNFQLLRVI